MKYFLRILWFCVFIVPLRAESENTELKRQFTVSSAYADKIFNSNEGLVAFPLSMIQAYSKLFEVTTEGFRAHWSERLLSILGDAIFSYWSIPALSVPFHEFGHARAIAAFGGTYHYGGFAYGHKFDGLNNYWTLSMLKLITPPLGIPGHGVGYTSWKIDNTDLSQTLMKSYGNLAGVRAIISASGLNNEMLLAKQLAQVSYDRQGHITYFPHYFGNKLGGLIYTLLDQDRNPHNDPKVNGGSDPGAILRAYNQKGYAMNHGHLKTLYLASLLSGTTYFYMRGYYDYLVNNNAVVRPAELYGFRIPDINGYINAQGLSWEIESDYRIAPFLTVGLAYEFIWKGDFAHQFTPRARYNLASALPKLNEFWLSGNLVLGNGIGGAFNADYAPLALSESNFWHRLAYFANLSVYNAYTLYGQRNIPSVARGNTVDVAAFAGMNFRY